MDAPSAATPKRGRPVKVRPQINAPDDEAARIAHQQAIGKRLQEQRTLRNWTPADLGHRADLTGDTVRQLEQGKRAPTTWTIRRLADALGCGAGWLAFGG